MAFTAENTGTASLRVYDGREPVCEVRDLRLQNVRFRQGGRLLIGEDVPLPLFWQQYANHEHPERNSGSNGSVRVIEESADRVVFECMGGTRSGSVLSEYVVTVNRCADVHTYTFDIQAALRVARGASWQVTHNPHHGELEFCNFWPEGVFSADVQKPLLYDACYIKRSGSVHAVPHHHLESSDKHNILLQPGDRMLWLLEDENPCIESLSGGDIVAGVCAYMWDAHLAYRVCPDEADRKLKAGTRYAASFRIMSLGREEGRKMAAAAVRPSLPDEQDAPIIVDGVHTFSETFRTTKRRWDDAWPWETEVVSGDTNGVRFERDRDIGMDDRFSLRVDSVRKACARWKATALGPAFRQPRFESGQRYRLVAYVRSSLTSGQASAAIRLHREGSAGLFEPETYEVHRTLLEPHGPTEWTRLEVFTPSIAPAPDRVHILLEIKGRGSCWFDNVHFTREG